MPSFLKHIAERGAEHQTDRGPVSYRRAHVDGMPFRGPAGLLREAEYDLYTETVKDANCRIFDMLNPDDKRDLEVILDDFANGRVKLYRWNEQWVEQQGRFTLLVFCFWVTPYKQLAPHRMPLGLQNGVQKALGRA